MIALIGIVEFFMGCLGVAGTEEGVTLWSAVVEGLIATFCPIIW